MDGMILTIVLLIIIIAISVFMSNRQLENFDTSVVNSWTLVSTCDKNIGHWQSPNICNLHPKFVKKGIQNMLNKKDVTLMSCNNDTIKYCA